MTDARWYSPDGKPMGRITGKNGKERNFTLADAKKDGSVPSVTTILSSFRKPYWETQDWDRLAGMCYDYAPLVAASGFSKEGWIDDVVRAFRQGRSDAAELGSAVHAYIDAFLTHQKQEANDFLDSISAGALCWWAENFSEEPLIQYERSFANLDRGYGGQIDLWTKGCLVDWKTCQNFPSKPYPDHGAQLAAYAKGVDCPDARLINVYIRVTDGETMVHEWDKDDAQELFDNFMLCRYLWYSVLGPGGGAEWVKANLNKENAGDNATSNQRGSEGDQRGDRSSEEKEVSDEDRIAASLFS